MPQLVPRPALRHEVGEIHAMLAELAEFEKISHLMHSTPQDFERVIFEEKILRALVLEDPAEETALAAVAIFYHNFSSFTGQTGLWLEDIYVRPQFRGHGFGSALMDRFLEIGREENCGRAEWSVLTWNEPAIRFYQAREVEVLDDWRICRLTYPR